MSVVSLRDKITTTIDGASDTVKDKVVQHFVDIELQRRIDLIITGMTKLTTAEVELAKIKPDHLIFGEDLKPIQQGWTGGQKSKRDKAQGLVDRINAALAAAITDADFKKLEEISKAPTQQGQPKEQEAA